MCMRTWGGVSVHPSTLCAEHARCTLVDCVPDSVSANVHRAVSTEKTPLFFIHSAVWQLRVNSFGILKGHYWISQRDS